MDKFVLYTYRESPNNLNNSANTNGLYSPTSQGLVPKVQNNSPDGHRKGNVCN